MLLARPDVPLKPFAQVSSGWAHWRGDRGGRQDVVTPMVGVSVTFATDERVDLGVITERTGLPTHRAVQAGDPRASPNGHRWPNPAPRSFWTFRTPDRATFDAQAVVVEVLDAIEPVSGPLRALVEELHLDAWLSVHVRLGDEETPDGTLAAGVLARIAALGLDLDVDLYPAAAPPAP